MFKSLLDCGQDLQPSKIFLKLTTRVWNNSRSSRCRVFFELKNQTIYRELVYSKEA